MVIFVFEPWMGVLVVYVVFNICICRLLRDEAEWRSTIPGVYLATTYLFVVYVVVEVFFLPSAGPAVP